MEWGSDVWLHPVVLQAKCEGEGCGSAVLAILSYMSIQRPHGKGLEEEKSQRKWES